MRCLICLCLLAILPQAAFADCASAELRVCVYAPLLGGAAVELPCAVAQCATSDAVFDYLGFGDGHFARIDVTGVAMGRMNANLGSLGGATMTTTFDDFPVEITGEYAYSNGGRAFLVTKDCDARCDTVDADRLMD